MVLLSETLILFVQVIEQRSGGTEFVWFVWSLRRSCLVGKSGVAVQLIAVKRVARDAHLLQDSVRGWIHVDGEAAQTLSDLICNICSVATSAL